MSNIDDGGPAFPGGDGPMAGNPQYYAPGMSLRDFIATAAMEKIVSPQAWSLDGAFNQKVYDNTAQHAYRYADAMLAARTPRRRQAKEHRMTDRHEAEGHGKGKVWACWTFVYPNTTVVGVTNDERLAIDIANGQKITPAVAIDAEAYNEVRVRLADMAANALHEHERNWTRDTLALLPEATQ